MTAALGRQVSGLGAAAAAGSGSFSFTVPVVTYPGRGESHIGITLTYNSRVWQKVLTGAGAERMVYDIDNDWPAPGWRFPFERITSTRDDPIFVGTDGTRHPAKVVDAGTRPDGTHFVEQITTDGSLVRFLRERWGPGGLVGWAKYPNGSLVEFTAPSDDQTVVFPTAFIDRHGNTTKVSYRGGTGPAIDTITDPTGRAVRFSYDAAGRLITITGPSCYVGPDIVLLRLHHAELVPEMSWDSKLLVKAPVRMPVIDGLMTPTDGHGYWFADVGDYCGYGMLQTVRECVGMTWAADLVDPSNLQGNITEGTPVHTRRYNYPAGSGPVQNDTPTYTQMEETFAGQDGPAERTQFAIKILGAGHREVSITFPDGSRTVQEDDENLRGPLSRVETFDHLNTSIQATKMQWETGANGAPRVLQAIHRTPIGAAVTDFLYGPVNNQVRETIERYPDGSVARRTTTDYDPGALYEERHILNLPSKVRVFDGDGSPLSRVDFLYDTGTLHPTPGVTGLDERFNPDSPRYEAATRARGLPTVVFRFFDPTVPTGGGFYITTMEYDLAGNLVQRDVGPQRVTTTYDRSTNYSLPTGTTTGSPDPSSPIRLTTRTSYNPAGRPATTTDVAGSLTEFNYTADGFRPALTYHQQEPRVEVNVIYHDAECKQTVLVRDISGDAVSTVVRSFDGLGRVSKIESANADGGWDMVEFRADALGRVRRTSAPYRQGDNVVFGTESYDPLGRILSRHTPTELLSQSWTYDNGSPGQRHNQDTFHSTMQTTDAWGRQLWAAYDSLGRLRSVAEPTPDGDGAVGLGKPTLNTDYWYIGLTKAIYCNLPLPNQPNTDSQLRMVRTDGLGRIIAVRLPERDATLTTPAAPNLRWSDLYSYDARGNLVSHTDPRGVVTTYYYNNDPLDRLQKMICDVAGLTDTGHPIADSVFLDDPFGDKSLRVEFTYETTGDLRRVATQACRDLIETYTYDSVGIASETITWEALPNGPLVTNYERGSLGRVTKVTYPAQWRQSGEQRAIQEYTYGVGGAVTEVHIDGAPVVSNCHFDPAGNLTTLTLGPPGSGQTVEDYHWDLWSGWLDHQSLTRNGEVLLDLLYGYEGPDPFQWPGKTGQVTGLTSAVAPRTGTTYEYDQLGRLRRTTHGPAASNTPDWTQEYVYDLFGNRTDVQASGNDAQGNPMRADGSALTFDGFTNRIDTPGWDYDAAGNIAQRPDPETGAPIKYAYDAAGRLATISDAAGIVILEHLYGICHRRRGTWYANTGDTVLYAWDGDNVVGQYTAEAPAQHGGDMGVDGKPRWFIGGHFLGSRQLLTVDPDQSTSQLHPGRTGTRFVTGSNGTPAEDAAVWWLPFGTRQLDQKPEAPVWGSGFAGYGAVDHGLAYAQHRFYDPHTGRFTTPDPLGIAGFRPQSSQSLNAYSYVNGDPINNTDPLGLNPCYVNRGGTILCYSEGTSTWEPATMTADLVVVIGDSFPEPPTNLGPLASPQATPWANPQGRDPAQGAERPSRRTVPKCKRPTGRPGIPHSPLENDAVQAALESLAASSEYHDLHQIVLDVLSVGAAWESAVAGVGAIALRSASAVRNLIADFPGWRLGWAVGRAYDDAVQANPLPYGVEIPERYINSIAKLQLAEAREAAAAAERSEDCF